jgi:thiol-disulfide isomerase/thioredoxin
MIIKAVFLCSLVVLSSNLFAAEETPRFHEEMEAGQRDYDEKLSILRKQIEELQRPINEEYSKKLQKILRENINDPQIGNLMERLEYLRGEIEPETIAALENSTNEPLRLHLISHPPRGWIEPIFRKYLQEEKNPILRCKLMSNIVTFHHERYRDLSQRGILKDEVVDPMLAEMAAHLAEVVEIRNVTKSEYKNLSILHDKMEKTVNRLTRLAKLRVGKPAPEIAGKTLDDQPMSLSDTRGKVTVVVFWASWCGPCMRMVPHERELYKRMQGKPFALVGVNRDHELKQAQEAVVKHEMPWPSWQDRGTEDSIAELYAVTGIPQVYVLDPQGIIRYSGVRGADLDAAVDQLLNETTAKTLP